MKHKFKIDEVVYVALVCVRTLITKVTSIAIENDTGWVWYKVNDYDRSLSENELCNDPSLIETLRKAE